MARHRALSSVAALAAALATAALLSATTADAVTALFSFEPLMGPPPAGFSQLNNTDAQPVPGLLQVRVGDCGFGYSAACNASMLAAACNATCGCGGFDS
jgi:hypothetical protein